MLGFLRLTAQECRYVQIISRNILADFADVLLNLVDHVWQRLLHGRLRDLAACLPGLWQQRLLLMDVFLIGVLKARGDNGDLHGVLHVVVLHGAEDDVGVLVRGFLNDARGFMDFMQREARASGNVDEDALRALDGVVFKQRAGDGTIGSWDVNGWKEKPSWRAGSEPLFSLVFGESAGSLIAASKDGTATFWQLAQPPKSVADPKEADQ